MTDLRLAFAEWRLKMEATHRWLTSPGNLHPPRHIYNPETFLTHIQTPKTKRHVWVRTYAGKSPAHAHWGHSDGFKYQWMGRIDWVYQRVCNLCGQFPIKSHPRGFYSVIRDSRGRVPEQITVRICRSCFEFMLTPHEQAAFTRPRV
jgi:hypothetical protein